MLDESGKGVQRDVRLSKRVVLVTLSHFDHSDLFVPHWAFHRTHSCTHFLFTQGSEEQKPTDEPVLSAADAVPSADGALLGMR